MQHHGINIEPARLTEFCETNGIRRLSLFGSILRDDFCDDSDVDVLVEFAPGRTPSLLRMAGLEAQLTGMIGRKVDLRTPADLSRYFREEVIRTSEVQYAARG
jgi:predicted nucleotidyltransferase